MVDSSSMETDKNFEILVSIITPIFDSEAYLEETIKSVIEQTVSNWELIIIDDCSIDNSIEIAESLSKDDSRIRIVKLVENSGAAVARNKGIGLARGRYIAFLDSDDLWLPTKLEQQLKFMQVNNCPFSFSAYERIDEAGKVIGLVGVPRKVSYREMLKTSVIGCLTAIYDTKYFGKVMMPLIRKRQDYGLWLKLLKQIDYAYGIQESLAQYRIRNGSISSNKLNTATYNWRLYREFEKLSLLQSCYFFVHYAVRGFLRNRVPRVARKLGIMD